MLTALREFIFGQKKHVDEIQPNAANAATVRLQVLRQQLVDMTSIRDAASKRIDEIKVELERAEGEVFQASLHAQASRREQEAAAWRQSQEPRPLPTNVLGVGSAHAISELK